MTWMTDAECIQSSANAQLFDLHRDVFDDTDRETPTEQHHRHALALRVCAGCHVTADCLTGAYASDATGVRGGVVIAARNGRSTANRDARSREATVKALRVLATLPVPQGLRVEDGAA